MNFSDISNTRLINQKIEGSNFQSAKDVVAHMGAMQAQDYNMVKWAIGGRLVNVTEKTINLALDNGEILRTHLLRPTWHLVTADDIYWMLGLTGPRILASLKSRHKQLELTEKVFNKSNSIIEKALSRGKHLTRDELVVELQKFKFDSTDNRMAHLIMRAELDAIICSGISKGKNTTYALLAERVPKVKTLPKEEALAKLAAKYFFSHGPATIQDFIWWSGLSAADAKRALEMVKNDFILETIREQTYILPNVNLAHQKKIDTAFLLPAFDEFLISYTDRKASIPVDESHKKVISNNGIFRPVIVIDGQVEGIWKRTTKKNETLLNAFFFQSPTKIQKQLVEQAAIEMSTFYNQKVHVTSDILK